MHYGPVIYSKDSKGTLRQWRYIVDGDKWTGESGQVGGTLTMSGWTHCVPKSQDTAEEQAVFEAEAEMRKKLERKYRSSIEALDADDVFIQPMLAHGVDDYDMVYPCYGQPKLDGFRCIMALDGDELVATTRQGKVYVTVDHIRDELLPLFQQYPDLVLDGELYNHDYKADFNTLSSLIRKDFKLDKKRLKAGVSEEEQRAELAAKQREAIQYHVYDVVDPTLSFEARIELVESLLGTVTEPFFETVQVVETMWLGSKNGAENAYEDALEEGYEGLMLRDREAVYQVGKRSKFLLKWKDFETKEFKLLRIEEGNGNWKGLAKRVVVELEDGTENEAGLRGNQAFAKELLDNADHYCKGEATIRFMRQRTPDGKLRAPVAIDFHPEGRKD